MAAGKVKYLNLNNEPKTFLTTQSRAFADANIYRTRKYWEYQMRKIPIDSRHASDYRIGARISRGAYSEVFMATSRSDNQPCVMKRLNVTVKPKIKKEIQILKELNGKSNVIKLLAVHRNPLSRKYHLVFPCFENLSIADRFRCLTLADIQFYMYGILCALHFCHRRGIMHRNVTPENVIIDVNQRAVRLIDWATAEYYFPNQYNEVRVGTFSFMAPELLIGYQRYDYAVDLWGFGCTLATMIFRRTTIFVGGSSIDHLMVNIASVIGGQQFLDFTSAYGMKRQFDKYLASLTVVGWEHFLCGANVELYSSEVRDLLDKLMVVDPYARMSASEAKNHAFFASVAD